MPTGTASSAPRKLTEKTPAFANASNSPSPPGHDRPMSKKSAISIPVHGRGASENVPNRFERLHYEVEIDDELAEKPHPATQYLVDSSRTIIAYNDSPDVGFSA